MVTCPHHPKTELRSFPKPPGDDMLYCTGCQRAYHVREGEVRIGVAVLVNPGVSLCDRCRMVADVCSSCGRPVCAGHTLLSSPDMRMCRECGDRLGFRLPHPVDYKNAS
jgi:hypothetical protein